jgi:amino acid adenylation domain-containing protein
MLLATNAVLPFHAREGRSGILWCGRTVALGRTQGDAMARAEAAGSRPDAVLTAIFTFFASMMTGANAIRLALYQPDGTMRACTLAVGSRQSLLEAVRTIAATDPDRSGEAPLYGLAAEDHGDWRSTTKRIWPNPEVERQDLLILTAISSQAINFRIVYDASCFNDNTIQNWESTLAHLLAQGLTDPDLPLASYDLVSTRERRRLEAWNATDVPRQELVGLHELLERQVRRTPQALAIQGESGRLTYGQLHQQSDNLASHLSRRGVGPGQVIAMHLPRGCALYTAMLAILKTRAAFLPLDTDYPRERLIEMVKQAKASVILHDGVDAPLLDGETEPASLDVRPLLMTGAAAASPRPEVRGRDVAYILFTSGSTGRPKGVMVPHEAICNRLLWMRDALGVSDTDVVLQKTPIGFDVSLWEIFLPLITGARLVFLPQGAHRDPVAIADFVQSYSVTLLHFVPSMLKEFLEEPAVGRLSSLRHVICSGEALSPALKQRCADQIGIAPDNLYGPTEAAIDVSWWPAAAGPDARRIPIGRPIDNIRLYVRDSELRALPIGAPGEICIAGIGLATGYVNDEKQTRDRFVVDPFAEQQCLYRTGDIGRFREDGALEWLGRTDSQVKINGMRLELEEVENLLEAHPDVSEAVALVLGEDANGRLIAVVTPRVGARLQSAALREHLMRFLPSSLLPSDVVIRSDIPLTATGKADRKALTQEIVTARERASSSSDVAVHASIDIADDLQRTVVSLWRDVLGVAVIRASDSFFALGGTSIGAVRMVVRVRAQIRRDVRISDVFARPSLQDFLSGVARAPPLSAPASQSRTPQLEPMLSPMQRRLWFLYVAEPASIRYNIAFALRIRGAGKSVIENALKAALQRHSALRCRIAEINGQPHVSIGCEPEHVFEDAPVLSARTDFAAVEAAKEWAKRPFDLAGQPPVRFALSEGENDHVLFICVHHLVFDEWSWELLLEELALGVSGEQASGISDSRAPTALSSCARSAAEHQRSLGFWLDRLADAPPPLDHPFDNSALLSGGNDPVLWTWNIARPIAQRIQAFIRCCNVTPTVFFLTAYATLLGRLSAQDDFVIALVATTRDSITEERQVGFFVNTLPLRLQLNARQPVREWMRSCAAEVGETLDHRHVPFDEIVAKLAAAHNDQRTDLAEICFVFREMPRRLPLPAGIEFETLDISNLAAQYLLKLDVSETAVGFRCRWVANSSFVSERMLEHMSGQINNLIDQMLDNPEGELGSLRLRPNKS